MYWSTAPALSFNRSSAGIKLRRTVATRSTRWAGVNEDCFSRCMVASSKSRKPASSFACRYVSAMEARYSARRGSAASSPPSSVRARSNWPDPVAMRIEGIDDARRAGDVLFRFEKAGVVKRQAHLVDGVVGNGGQTFAGAFLDLVEPQTAGGLLKVGQRGGRFLKIHARLQQRFEILPALLRFQHGDAQRDGLSRRVGREGGHRLPLYPISCLGPSRQLEQPVAGGVLAMKGAGGVFPHGARVI